MNVDSSAVSPAVAHHAWVQALGVVGFALATAVGARIAIPIDGTPVPITLQTMFVVLAGMTLGPWLGTLSMVFYLLLGVTGYHVFASSAWAPDTVIRATGGFLVGFVLAQPAIGMLTRRCKGRAWGLIQATAVGSATIFAVGLIWLHLWLGHVSWAESLRIGFYPFVPGLLLKSVAVVAGGLLLQPISRKYFQPRQ